MLVADELIAAEDLDAYKAAYGTTAYLVDMATAEEFVGSYGDEITITAIATADIVDGTYAFEGLANGEYAVIIARNGALPYMEYAFVEDADVDMGEVTVLFGDVTGAKDFVVDGADITLIAEAVSDITETDIFVADYDVAHDCIIDGADITEVIANVGDITLYGSNMILDFFG